MSLLVSVSELSQSLDDEGLRVVDTRFDLRDAEAGRRAFAEGHLPGAVYAHLEEDLSGPVGRHGGRHPLPATEELARRLGELGIGNEHRVVVYDEESGIFASRLWWLLRFLGHDRVQVLDGGYRAWREAGQPLAVEAPRPRPAAFEPRPRPEMVVGREYLLRNLGNPEVLLVDARAAERYRGEVEPIDPLAGHIPSAVNLPYGENLEAGRFKSAPALRRSFERLGEPEEVVVYCGSGVSAAHQVLAMELAGVETQVRLYPGSWSDWCSFADSPVARGDEP